MSDETIRRLEERLSRVEAEREAERRAWRRAAVGSAAALVVLSLGIWATALAVPNTFEPGGTISSSGMNANFAFLEARSFSHESVYRTRMDGMIDPDSSMSATAQCRDANDILLSGSCRGRNHFVLNFNATPLLNGPEERDAFLCNFRNTQDSGGAAPLLIQAYAICFAMP